MSLGNIRIICFLSMLCAEYEKKEGIRRTRIDFIPSRSERWFLVVENEAREDTSVEIRLFIASP